MTDDEVKMLVAMAEDERRLLDAIQRWMKYAVIGFSGLVLLLICLLAVCRSIDKGQFERRYDELRQLIHEGKCQCRHHGAVNNINTVVAVSPLDELIYSLNRQWQCRMERENDGSLRHLVRSMDDGSANTHDGKQRRQSDADESDNRSERPESGIGQSNGLAKHRQ